MVGRLVQHQDVRPRDEESCQPRPGLLAARERGELAIHLYIGKAEPVEERVQFCKRGISAKRFELVAGQRQRIRCFDRIYFRVAETGRRVLDRIMGPHQPSGRHIDEVAQSPIRDIGEPLSQVSDRCAGGQEDGTGIRRQVTRQDTQQRRLAGAIRPDETKPISWIDGKGDVLEEKGVSETFGDIVDHQHVHSCGNRGLTGAQRAACGQ